MDHEEFERCRAAIDAANTALDAHLDAVQESMFGSAAADTARSFSEFDRLVRMRDLAEADLASHL
ncbi:MAG: hypothetical protein ABI628_03215 [Chloroflexota bacterium]